MGTLACASDAGALVVTGMNPMPAPTNGWIGNYNGSTGVCVGPDWIISAKHTGGGVTSWFNMRGQAYQVIEARPHPVLDIQLLRVDRPLPGYHRIAERVALNDPAILGGCGVTAAAALPDGTGYDWAGPRQETWGANTVEMEGNLLGFRFDAPSDSLAVPFEACFAVNDSGGGAFVVGSDGELELAGIAVSVMGWGATRWGNTGFAVNVVQYRNWILPIVDPGLPITSGTEAPQAMLGVPGVDPRLSAPLLGVLLLSRRRRAR